MRKLNLIMVIALGAFAFTSCKKDEDVTPEEEQDTTPTTASPNFNFPDADGVLSFVNTVTIQNLGSFGGFDLGFTEFQFYTATATFFGENSTTFIDAGNVTVEGKALNKQNNNAYVYTNVTDSIKYEGSLNWTVSGGSDISSFTHSISSSVPVFSTNPNLSEISNDGYWLPYSSTADSVLVLMASGSKQLLKTYKRSSMIPASDYSQFSVGETVHFQLTPFSIHSNTNTSGKFYYTLQSTYTYPSVEIVD